MRTAFTSLLLLAAMAGAQTINPNQIRPGTNGQVLTTSSGVTGWGTGQFTLGSTVLALGGTYTTVAGVTINGVQLVSTGSTSLFLNQAGTYTAPTVSAPTFNLIGTGTNTTAAMVCGTGCTLTPTGTGVITPNAINLAALGNGGIVGNLPVANLNGGINASAATAWFGDGTWKTVTPGGVLSINSQTGAFTFSGAGVNCTLTTCTFSGAGPANISGGTAGHVPLFGSATTITANSHIDEVTTPGATTVTQQMIINDGTGHAGNFALTAGTTPSAAPANSIQLQAPTSVTAYSLTLPSATGTGALTNNGSGGLSWIPPAATTPVNPIICTSSTATSICITDTTYNGSAAGTTTTTVSGTFTAGTSGTIASCSTFSANNGIAIAGAGTAGGLYIGKVVSCTAGALVVTPATTTTVSASNVVQHDETSAINTAIAALNSAGGGDIWFPIGTYLVNGPLQDPGGSNSILPMPVIANYVGNMVRIGLRGLQHITTTTAPASIIQTSATSGNLLAGYDSATGGGLAPFTNVYLDVEDLTLVAPDNPQIVMINALTILNLMVKNVLCITTGSTFPTHSTSGCVVTPELGNNVRVNLDNVSSSSFYTGFQLGEHSHSGSLYAAKNVNAVVFDPGANAGIGSVGQSAAQVDYLWCQGCTNTMAAGAHTSIVSVSAVDNESPTTTIINDPSNRIFGIININNTISGGLGTSCAGTGGGIVNGAQNVQINWLTCGNVVVGNSTATPSGIGGLPVLGSAGTVSGQGGIIFQENKSLGSDLKFWDSSVQASGTLTFRAVNDAYTLANNWLTVTRTGFVPGTAAFAIPVTTPSLLASGTVDGTAPVTVTTGTTATIGGTYKSGYTFNQEATAATGVAYTLPTAAAGLQYCVGNSYNGSAPNTGILTVNTSASGQFIIFTDGTLSATGGNVTSGGAAMDFACFVGVDSTHWYFKPSSGTWTKH